MRHTVKRLLRLSWISEVRADSVALLLGSANKMRTSLDQKKLERHARAIPHTSRMRADGGTMQCYVSSSRVAQ